MDQITAVLGVIDTDLHSIKKDVSELKGTVANLNNFSNSLKNGQIQSLAFRAHENVIDACFAQQLHNDYLSFIKNIWRKFGIEHSCQIKGVPYFLSH